MRDVQELRFTTHDGVELFYRHWPASRPAPDGTRQAVLLFHRGHEHSGRIAHLVDELDLPEHDFFAWDARGHGLSPGARGDSPSFATSVRDVQTFVDHIQAVHGIAEERMAVVAQSVGAVLVSTWAHDYAPKVRALVLASPAFQVKLYVPFARSGLKLMRLWRGNFFVNSYVKARFLSHDPQRIASYDSDPLIAKAISVNVLLGLYEAAERVVADAQAIQIPTQLLISGADFVVHLAAPLPKNSPRDLYWRATRAGLRLGSLWSDGVKLGFDTGFDSGSTLDYVYRNQPSGSGPLGRLIDRNYLDSIGWRGIRQRKLHAEELLRLAMQRLREEQREVRIVDIAAGHGRYILEALQGVEPLPESILLRDYSEINVRDGSALIESKGLAGIARFVKGDAFDRADLAALQPKPSLGVVSGLYELFADNRMVGDSLAGLGEALEEGGYLVYTGQPWHPQLELIARALTSHRQGQAWVMRRRTQAEMDQLVAAAGFRKITQRVDQWGIFSVSLAQKVAR
ncbi:hypothetical protein B2G63_29070 [Pseudomonas aeruginosa]|nr:hypothetical protein B2G63_29070 [Pseudomonas aeruginosa]